ncbi:hypothetical protein QTH89_05430 [Variovorax sp. J22G21]|uniref:hypothetical protein n=1 Tax=Variovorax fucosicus TaxID=3053517 RepID=UPI00257870FA|nr:MULTISPECIES: hypothetical protein [unclassified Variovorax]MDM0041587.1 hypothetical protein [Variovorax sp. J22R193]MDM0057947.1 hypothetical protein [Variovorax sp. J22G47]MDM0060643.1 hypothetical protein [Variovorax sp. J22G21]
MNDDASQRTRTKLEWEAACEKLGNALVPPYKGLPSSNRDDIVAYFDQVQRRLDQMRAVYGIGPRLEAPPPP